MFSKLCAASAAVAMVVLAGCGGGAPETKKSSGGGGGGSTEKKAEKKAAAGGGQAYDKSKFKGSVAGVVSFEGEAKQGEIDTAGDKACHAMHKDAPLKSETIVAKDGKLANVIVYLASGTDKYSYESPKDPLVIDQKGCQYVPHVAAKMTEQPLIVKSSDELTHNVHGLSPTKTGNPEFNETQSKAGAQYKTEKVVNPEIVYTLQCDVHKWMSAKVGVFEHPFFAVTGEDGKFKLDNVPDGEYEVVAWHEKLGEQKGKVTVKDGAVDQNFSFKK
jgi:hypothetical protein